MPKKNRMSVSCDVEDEINFKAICDVLNGGVLPTINSKHSTELVKLMKRFYKNNRKKLSPRQQVEFNKIKAQYLANKHKNQIF